MKYKTAELEGALLDAAVAKALGWERGSNWCSAPGKPGLLLVFGEPEEFSEEPRFAPSAVWADGGPIIERERIATWDNGALHPPEDCTWTAGIQPEGDETANDLGIFALWMHVGPTPLIAAMRAYVASKLGEEVELP